MKKNLFTLCMMLLLSMLSFAQGSLTISGVVTEKKTGVIIFILVYENSMQR